MGRVFTRDELLALAERAEAHDLIICSDEIHCGLVLDGTHLPIAALDDSVITSYSIHYTKLYDADCTA